MEREYEGMFILSPNLNAEEALDELIGKIEDIIKKNNGKIANRQNMGIKDFAYPIKKHKKGHYVLINFALDSEKINEIRSFCGINELILRDLITSIKPDKKVA